MISNTTVTYAAIEKGDKQIVELILKKPNININKAYVLNTNIFYSISNKEFHHVFFFLGVMAFQISRSFIKLKIHEFHLIHKFYAFYYVKISLISLCFELLNFIKFFFFIFVNDDIYTNLYS